MESTPDMRGGPLASPPEGPARPAWWQRLRSVGPLGPFGLALPGFLVGVHLGGLLFFLNPHLPFEVVPVARACLVYGGLGGLFTLVLGLPLARLGRKNLARLVPWSLTVALALAALLDSTHASHYAYYLPSGINDRLIKASLWLTLATLIAFYTALLHSLHRRPYGIRSRLAYVALCLASVYVMVERREAFEPRPETARPTVVEGAQRPRLLVVGIESASLDALLPLSEEGRTPFFDRALEEGAYGHLDSIRPNRPAALWTTLATGKYPHRHGVVGGGSYPLELIAPGARLRLLPAGIGFDRWGVFGAEPLAEPPGAERRVRALWEILPLLGVRTGVVGWPASAPLRPGPVFAVSDRFFAGRFDPAEVRPPELLERARIFRVGTDELDPRLTSHFGDERPAAAVEALAHDIWRQSLAVYLAESGSASGSATPAASGTDAAVPEALFVQLPGLAEISRRTFGGHAELRLEGHAAEPELERAAGLLADYYAAIDLLVAELWDRIPEPKLLAVVSAFGVEQEPDWYRSWARAFGHEEVGGSWAEAPAGVIVLYGSGIRAGTLLTGARLTDLTPTLLYALGLPVARDLDGRILTESFLPELLEQPLTFVPSYERLEPRSAEGGAALNGPSAP